MAENPLTTLTFEGQCPDCAERRVQLPAPLPQVGDDFDWLVRDFDSFRRFMLEELAARFPERTRWTPADLEVVLVEILSAVLDQLSDMADRVAREGYLETARRPESVRRLLSFIGYDAPLAEGIAPDSPGATAELERRWNRNPLRMDAARRAGPPALHTQRRMVTVGDYATRLEEHPLVRRATAWSSWTGSWSTVRAAVILWQEKDLDDANPGYTPELQTLVEDFHLAHGFHQPVWQPSPPAIRTLLRTYVEAYRMAGQEVLLENAVPVGIKMSISIRVKDTYFRSEIRDAVQAALGTGPGGFFAPGRLGFGDALHASDIFQTLMALDGVENVCLNLFKRFGSRYADQSATGWIALDGLEIAVCDNNPRRPERGFYYLKMNGGRRG